MKKIIILASLILLTITANAKATTKTISEINNKTLDLIIQKLESSGKLEEALVRAIDKRIQADKEDKARESLAQEKKNQENANLIKGFSDKEHYMGDKLARYSIISYEDMECPFCKLYAQIPENAIKKLNGVNFISRPNPLEFHMPVAAKEAVLAECVANELGNEGYFNFTRAIFKDTLTNGQGLPNLPIGFKLKGSNEELASFEELKNMDKSLFAVAKQIGIKDITKTLECYKDSNVSLTLQNLVQYSKNHGITGTPTTIIKDNKTGKGSMIIGIVTEEDLIERVKIFILAQ